MGIALSEGTVSAYAAAEIGDLVEEASNGGPLAVIAVDIPIGLPDKGRRKADILARRAVGSLWPSVFMTPVRPALEAADYATAAGFSRHLAGRASPVRPSPCRPRSSRSSAGTADPAPRGRGPP